MNNGLCPECGTELEITAYEIPIGYEGDESIAEIHYSCPYCEFWELRYED